MLQTAKRFSGIFTQDIKFLLSDEYSTYIVEIYPTAAGTASISKSSDNAADIIADSNVNWFAFPDMPVTAAYENIVHGATGIFLDITSGTWKININSIGVQNE